MKKWLIIFFAIVFFIMAAFPVYAKEDGLVYYSPQYTSLSKFKDGIAIYTVNDQLGFVDTNGKESLLRTGEYVWHGDNTVILRDSDMIYGYTYSKEKLFEFKCTAVYGIHERMIVIEVDESIGVINFNGTMVLPCGEYDMIRIKDSSSIWYSSNDVWYELSLVNGSKKEISFMPLVALDNSFCIGIDTYVGLYKGEEVIVKGNYSSYYIFDDKYVFVGYDGSCIYDLINRSIINLDGINILDCDEYGYTYYSISDDKIYYVQYDNAESYEFDMLYVGIPSDDYMVICETPDRYSYCTLNGEESTQLTWNMAFRFKEGYALCYDYIDDDKSVPQWYIVDKNFEIEKTLEYDVYVDTSYPASTDFSDGYIRTIDRDTGLMGFIRLDEFDFDDELVNPGLCVVSGSITSYGDADEAVTVTLYDADGTEIDSDITTDGTYSLSTPTGTYTMMVSKENHVTGKYTVIVGNGNVTQNVSIYLLGDANLDGKADSSDAVAILRKLAGYDVSKFNEKTADFNGDGKADSSDAVAILRKLAGY